MIRVGNILVKEIALFADSVQVGQKIKFNEHKLGVTELTEAVVIAKYPWHCLVRKELYNTSVKWIDLMLEGNVNVSV